MTGNSSAATRQSTIFGLFAALLCLWLVMPPASAQSRLAAFYDADPTGAARAPGTLLKSERLRMPAMYRATSWRILYSTRDFLGRPLVSSGVVVVSAVPQRQPGPRKVVAWAHPTVGTARTCAPSLKAQPHTSILGINDLVSMGYVVVATDYPGLGTPGPIGYLVGKGQAYAILDAVRAMQQLPNTAAGNDVMLWGYSQGGHAALFAAQVAGRYTPSLSIRGVAAIAPPTDLNRLLLRNIGSLEGRILAAFTLQSWAVKYGLSLRSLVRENSLAGVLAVNQQCIDSLQGKIDVLSAQKKLDPNFLMADPSRVANWDRAIAENSVSAFPSDIPVLILQGDRDEVVRPKVTAATLAKSCKPGARIKYVTLPGAGHGAAPAAGKDVAISWMISRFAGQDFVPTCP